MYKQIKSKFLVANAIEGATNHPITSTFLKLLFYKLTGYFEYDFIILGWRIEKIDPTFVRTDVSGSYIKHSQTTTSWTNGNESAALLQITHHHMDTILVIHSSSIVTIFEQTKYHTVNYVQKASNGIVFLIFYDLERGIATFTDV